MLKKIFRFMRCFFWRFFLRLDNVHETFLCGGYSDVAKDLIAGKHVYLAPGCLINPGVSIGDYSLIGPSVKIVGNDHVFSKAGVPIVF
ncbi:MAG: acetyltransferase, partial [Burkholderiales bacterium]|nr:acetyltransferase [Burkholderiales bacterium]